MRKINVKFAVILGISVICFGAAVHLLHRIQIGHSAETLRIRAGELKEENNLREALQLYNVYLRLCKDDVNAAEAEVEAAFIAEAIAESPNRTGRDIGEALGRMEITVRNHPDQAKLRRRLVIWKMRVGQWTGAIDHLEFLGADQPDAEAELKLQYSQCLLQTRIPKNLSKAIKILHAMIGFDADAKIFDLEKAIDATNVAVYRSLESIYRQKLDKPDLAVRIIEQVVKANPESSDAHLALASNLMSRGEKDEARAEIEKALKLAPDNQNAILTLAHLNIQEDKFDEAKQGLDYGVDEYPENPSMYVQLERLATRQGDHNEARLVIEKGLAKIPQSQSLRWRLAMHQLRAGEMKKVEKTLKVLKDTNFSQDKLDYLKAVMMMLEGDIIKASREFERVRPLLTRYSDRLDLTFKTDQYLATCYGKLGHTDLQLEALLRVIPFSGPAVVPFLQCISEINSVNECRPACQNGGKVCGKLCRLVRLCESRSLYDSRWEIV